MMRAGAAQCALARAVAAARRRTDRRPQAGYALMFVLGVIALTSVVIVALLGLALTSARIAQEQAVLARETRAGDGALEAAVADVARNGGDPCDVLSGNKQVAFAGVGGAAIDVDVACSPSGTPDGADPEAFLFGPRVEVVGTGTGTDAYNGTVAAPPMGAGAPDATLRHEGPGRLRFLSDVLVNQTAAVRRTDAGGSPAVDVTGQYGQRSTLGGGCGPLAAAGGASRIIDHSGAPACGAGVEQVTAQTPIALVPFTGPARPSISCPPGGVLALAPGSYSTLEVRALDRILQGSCAEAVTVWFQPGIHALDVNDPLNPAGDRNALVINDPRLKVVFGTPNGWSPATGPTAAQFPRACDPTQSGATLQLSGRSAIRHRAGRVAMCPFINGVTPLPAIVQVAQRAGTPQLVGASGQFQPAANLGSPTAWASSRLDCRVEFTFDRGFFWVCDAAPSFSTTWANLGGDPLTSATLLVNAQLIPDTIGPDTPASFTVTNVETQFTVSGGATPACTTSWLKAGRSYGGTIAYDLRSGGCQGAWTNESDLEGATVTATFRRDDVDPRPIGIQVRNVQLETNARTLAGTSAVDLGSGWTDLAGVTAPGGQVASPAQTPVFFDLLPGLSDFLRWEARPTTYNFRLDGLDFSGGTADPTEEPATLSVLARGRPTGNNIVSDPGDGATYRFDLKLADGRQCTSGQSDTHSRSNQELRFDLLGGTGTCAGVVNKLSDLTGASLTVTLVTGCAEASGIGRPILEDGTNPASRCASAALPEFDFLGLSVTTDTVTKRPPASEVTVDVRSGAATGTSFDVYGSTVLPRGDLDIHWKGTHYARPLFGGLLHVHGLGSDVASGLGADAVGAVCCTPLEGAGLLQARIGSTVRAQAAIRVDSSNAPVGGALRPVAILDWKLCGRGGC